MDLDLKEIIVAYFNGGNATYDGDRMKLAKGIKEDLEAIRDFYKESSKESK